MAGFVYVMTNPAFPHLVKIGKSAKDPRQDRVSELNHTGVPQPFRVEYYAFVEGEHHLEKWLHSYFDSKRPNKGREFFEIDVVDAISAIRDAAKLKGGIKYEEIFYVSPKELDNHRKQREFARQREEHLAAERRAAEARRRQEEARKVGEEKSRKEKAEADAKRYADAALARSRKKKIKSIVIMVAGVIVSLVLLNLGYNDTNEIGWLVAVVSIAYGLINFVSAE